MENQSNRAIAELLNRIPNETVFDETKFDETKYLTIGRPTKGSKPVPLLGAAYDETAAFYVTWINMGKRDD
jgi:hypothetical protein